MRAHSNNQFLESKLLIWTLTKRTSEIEQEQQHDFIKDTRTRNAINDQNLLRAKKMKKEVYIMFHALPKII